MYRRKRISSRMRKVLIGVTVAALAGGAYAVGTGMSNASVTCDGLDQALQRNLDFMADQRAHPTAQTPAILQNRQDVINLINLQRKEAGCTGSVVASLTTAPTKATKPAQNTTTAPTAAATTTSAATGTGSATGTGAGEVVCKGSTVTLSGEAGAPAASSGTFPIGTKLKVTNLDNNKSITVTVTSPSGSCALLNNAAFEEVREPGKFLVRHAVIERVG